MPPKRNQLKTARCILTREDQYFMVVHHSRLFSGKRRWGLPGGRIEADESCRQALVRELQEELFIDVGDLLEVGDYQYKGHDHRIFAADCETSISRFNRSEIRSIGWHSAADLQHYEEKGLLHAGFEWRAIQDYQAITSPGF